MAIRQIVTRGDEILAKNCKSIKQITPRIRALAEDLIDTMRASNGVGLAAPQVGVIKQIFVACPDAPNMEDVIVMINPEITYREGEQICTEGCLSVPGYIGLVKRPLKIKIKYQDLEGSWNEEEYEDFGANVICHEYDHLSGVLYTEKTERLMTEEEYEEYMNEQQEQEEERS